MIVQPRHCRPALVNTNRPVRASKLANDSRVNYQRTNFMNQMPWIVPNPHYTASMFANQAFVYADAPYNMPQLGSHGNVGRAPEQSSGTASGLWSQAMPTPPMSTISQAAYLYMNGAHNNNAQFGHHTGAGHLPSHAAWRPPFYGLSGFNQSTAGDTKTSLDPFTAVAGSRHHS